MLDFSSYDFKTRMEHEQGERTAEEGGIINLGMTTCSGWKIQTPNRISHCHIVALKYRSTYNI